MDQRNCHIYKPVYELRLFIFAALLSLLILFLAFSGDQTDFAQIGLGSNGKSVYAENERGKIHCSDPWGAQSCLTYRPNARHGLWLGASQLHVIMRAQDGNRTAPDLLSETLFSKGIDLRTVSSGNANLQELLLIYETARHKERIDFVLIGLVYDDLKEEEIHSNATAVLDSSQIVKALEKTSAGRETLDQLQAIQRRTGTADAASLQSKVAQLKADHQKTLQEHVEGAFVGWLESHTLLWHAREQARGHIYVSLSKLHDWLLMARYTLMGRKAPISFVQIPAGVRDRNMAALHALLQSAKASGVEVLVYIAPRPQDVTFPYHPDDYVFFKVQAEAAVLAAGGRFLNLENSLDDDVWGTIHNGMGRGAKDLFHFDAQGHKSFATLLWSRFFDSSAAR